MTLTTTLISLLLFTTAYAMVYFIYHGVRELIKTTAILFKD